MKAKALVPRIHTEDGLTFDLHPKRMEMAFHGDTYSYRASRSQIAKLFRVKMKSGKRTWTSVRYSVVEAGHATVRAASALALKTRVHIGCQVFRGKNVAALREWALSF